MKTTLVLILTISFYSCISLKNTSGIVIIKEEPVYFDSTWHYVGILKEGFGIKFNYSHYVDTGIYVIKEGRKECIGCQRNIYLRKL